VPSAAVRRHLAPATPDVWICSLAARRVVAYPRQLVTEALVLRSVQHGVRFAAVQRHSAPGTFVEERPVPGLDRARR
jgi:hypothetical protein